MMKKLLCAMLTLMLFALSCVPALAEAPAPSVGGWSVNTGDPADIPQEVLDAFSKAVEGLTGCVYEPIALLASQVVAGMNYCLLCRLTVVYPDAQPTYALVYVCQNIEGAWRISPSPSRSPWPSNPFKRTDAHSSIDRRMCVFFI